MAEKKKSKKRVKFELEASPKSEVYVAGSFNGWNPSDKRLKYSKSNGIHSVSMLLDRDREFEYKYVVDGYWCLDPNNDQVVANRFGSMNSVLKT